jgi:hypothetical protein
MYYVLEYVNNKNGFSPIKLYDIDQSIEFDLPHHNDEYCVHVFN